MRPKYFSAFHVVLMLTVLNPLSFPCQAQTFMDLRGDIPGNVPGWCDILSASAEQSGPYIKFQIETASSFPGSCQDSCFVEFLLHPLTEQTCPNGERATAGKQTIRFDLSHWDGSPWFAMNTYFYDGNSEIPSDSSRMFDWKLLDNKLWVRFSLDGSVWYGVRWQARIFYRDQYVDAAPDTGFTYIQINRDSLVGIESTRGALTLFTYPISFDSVLSTYSVTKVCDEAYRLERELTDVLPVCGGSVRYVFNPYFGGAAIEGDPIYLGPGMWGNRPLWFVYFHELGHDFCNASARFRQLYPLTIGLPPGQLPFNILFYEAWASLPTMYVYDVFASDSAPRNIPENVIADIRSDWEKTSGGFVNQWVKYKAHPTFSSVNPDIIDGLFLQLKDRYGWDFFRRFYDIMRPQDGTLAIFDERVPSDSIDLRFTRSTLTAVIFSAIADEDLCGDFRLWDFPINDSLFENTYPKLQRYMETIERREAK